MMPLTDGGMVNVTPTRPIRSIHPVRYVGMVVRVTSSKQHDSVHRQRGLAKSNLKS